MMREGGTTRGGKALARCLLVTPNQVAFYQQLLIAKGNHRGLLLICSWLIALSRSNMESVVLETSMGDVQLELYWDHAPQVRS